MANGRRRGPVTAMVVATLVASLLAVGGTGSAAGSQAVPTPTATLSSDGTYLVVVDCDGVTTIVPNGGFFVDLALEATATVDTTVTFSYSGSLAASAEASTDSATVPAGSDAATLFLEITRPGSLTITIEPGVGYLPGPPLTLDIGPRPDPPTCVVDEVEVTEVVGQPMPDVYRDTVSAHDAESILRAGALPPGITGEPFGPLAGTLSEVGDYSFTMANVVIGIYTVYELRVTVHVLPLAPILPDGPPVAPPPAVARPGTATYTG